MARLASGLVALLGILVAIALIVHHGFHAILSAVLEVGWGLLGIALFHLIPLVFSSLSWQCLLSRIWRGSFGLFFRARWIRESVNDLLPVAQIGGQVVGARVLTSRGASPGVAGAGIVVDLTVETFTQLLFVLLGLVLLIGQAGYDGAIPWIALGVALAVPALAGFVLAQRWGLFKLIERFLERLAEKWTWMAMGRVAGLHATIHAIYRDRRALLWSSVLHLLAWVLGIGEVWLTLYLMGVELGWREALILESLGQAVRSAAFVVPAGLGAQEGGFLLLGSLLGLSPELALALSLVKRVRDLALGLPGLVVWQYGEGRGLWLALRRARGR